MLVNGTAAPPEVVLAERGEPWTGTVPSAEMPGGKEEPKWWRGWLGRGGGRESIAETNFKNGCKESSRGHYYWRREEERKTETGKRLRPRAMALRSRRKSGPR